MSRRRGEDKKLKQKGKRGSAGEEDRQGDEAGGRERTEWQGIWKGIERLWALRGRNQPEKRKGNAEERKEEENEISNTWIR